MSRIFKSRYYQIVTVIVILMLLLALRLFSLAVLQNEKWETLATSSTVKEIYTTAPRGEIMDRYGRTLAGNIQTFSLKFSAADLEDEEINRIALDLIRIMESNGDVYYDNLPIVMENGAFVYTYQKEISEWLVSQGMPADYTADQAFNWLRNSLSIDPELSKYEAQSEMQNIYKIFPPISVKNMKFSKDLDKESFLGKFYLDTDLSAKDAFYALREKLKIDKSISDEEARKIMVIRNEVASMGYSKYMPATLAKGISNNTIIAVEEKNVELPGTEVVSESVRDYPNLNSASHVIGYLGRISESDKEKYVKELKYNPNDLIGQDGIEKKYEDVLKGKDGVKKVQVNAHGELVQVISEEEPQKGKDVYLTIDLELQKVAEAALAQSLKKIQVGGSFESSFGNYKYSKAYPANAGAAVAIEVETGDVLAMVSAPDFDPNLFASGISTENWNSLQSPNPRDSLAPAPLYNIAARTSVQPGSTFKMVTATAALESGLDPNKELHDGGAVYIGIRPYACLSWHRGGGGHGNVNLAEALEVSCNYYFYDIATGKDYYTGKSLGYKNDIDISTITSYGKQYGLGLPTGIEIPETVEEAPTAEQKMRQMKTLLKRNLNNKAATYFKEEVVKDEPLLEAQIDEITTWCEIDPVLTRGQTIERIKELGTVKDNQVEDLADLCKFTYFNYAKWNQGDEFNIAIGQGENRYTPLQMANYVATIGNNGVRNTVSLINAVEGQGKNQKAPGTKVDVSDDNLDTIIKGMKLVSSGQRGSLRSIFSNFPVSVAAKTGTAEKEGRVPPISEVEYVKKYLGYINSKLTWAQVETEILRLMAEQPEKYTSQDLAVARAIINLSDGVSEETILKRIAANKREYEPFSWVVAMAPADDPKIAVAVLIFQGGTSGYAAPVAREVIGEYLQLDKEYTEYSIKTTMR